MTLHRVPSSVTAASLRLFSDSASDRDPLANSPIRCMRITQCDASRGCGLSWGVAEAAQNHSLVRSIGARVPCLAATYCLVSPNVYSALHAFHHEAFHVLQPNVRRHYIRRALQFRPPARAVPCVSSTDLCLHDNNFHHSC
jgi:hypothetical protein